MISLFAMYTRCKMFPIYFKCESGEKNLTRAVVCSDVTLIIERAQIN